MLVFSTIIVFMMLSYDAQSFRLPNADSLSTRNHTISSYSSFCPNNSQSVVFNNFVTCDAAKESVIVQPFYCLTYQSNQSGVSNTSGVFYAGVCPFTSVSSLNSHGFELPSTIKDVSHFNEKHMCLMLNRTGVSCGACNSKSAATLNSFSLDCLPVDKCQDYSWVYLLLADLVPVTVLFAVVVVFDVKLTSGYAYTYILFSQLLSIQMNFVTIKFGLEFLTKNNQHSETISLSLLSFYSVWSLDLGRILASKLCIGKDIDTMDAIALQYLPAFYSLLLIFIAYFLVELHKHNNYIIVQMWRPFVLCCSRFRRLNPTTSLINAFAIFLLLSYSKLTVTSLMLVSPTYLYNINNKPVATVYLYDGTMSYFIGWKAVFLSTFGFTILFLFVLSPPMLLVLYPIKRFRKILEYLRLHRPAIMIFMDAFQSCYKDGTNGTTDCRWFSAVYFFFRIIVFTAYIFLGNFVLFNHAVLFIVQAMAIFVLLIVLFISPYKRAAYNKLDITMLALCIFIVSLIVMNWIFEKEGDPIIVEIFLLLALSIPLIGAMSFVGYHIVLRFTVCMRLSLKAWCGARNIGDNSNSHSLDNNNGHSSEMTPESDFTPSLPDRLLHPYLYSEDKHSTNKDYFSTFYNNYGSTTSTK